MNVVEEEIEISNIHPIMKGIINIYLTQECEEDIISKKMKEK